MLKNTQKAVIVFILAYIILFSSCSEKKDEIKIRKDVIILLSQDCIENNIVPSFYTRLFLFVLSDSGKIRKTDNGELCYIYKTYYKSKYTNSRFASN